MTDNLQAAYLLWSALQARQNFFAAHGPSAYFADYLLNVVAILFSTTLYSSNPIILNILLVSPALLLYVLPPASTHQKRQIRPSSTVKANVSVEGLDRHGDPPVRPFISAYRGGMMIVTCTSILAVDFRVFPRRFAKVENWGTSLMDMGVGSFVFSAGLVSARLVLKNQEVNKAASLLRLLQRSLRSSLPLLILGFVRLYSVKGLDYAEHVTEYGVHWNFFFTLALLPPFVNIFQLVVAGPISTAICSLAVSAMYQAVLDFTNLKSYILTAPRVSLLSQNREGICSLAGYLAIFLAGQATGYAVFRRVGREKDPRKQLVFTILIYASIWTCLFLFTTSYIYGLGLRVSRRLANLPYVMWVSAFNCAQISVYCIIDTLCFPGLYLARDGAAQTNEVEKATSQVIKAFNRNGLAIFLLANLMTGFVNMTLDTLTTGPLAATMVLLGYAAVLTTVVLSLDHWKVSLKL